MKSPLSVSSVTVLVTPLCALAGIVVRASDSDRAIPSRGTKQSMTDVHVNQLSTSSVPSCLRALRVDRQDAFLPRSQ